MKRFVTAGGMGMLAWLLSALVASSSVAYVRQELFEENQAASGRRFLSSGSLNFTGPTQLLSERGEVLYLFGSLDANRPGLWLPQAGYGLAAGPNDFTGLEAGSRQAVLLGEFGTFYTILQRPHGLADPPSGWYLVMRGEGATEASMGPAITYVPLGVRPDPTSHSNLLRRQARYARGVGGGQRIGEAQVQVKWDFEVDTEFNWVVSRIADDYEDSGVFRESTPAVVQPPGEEDAPECPRVGPGPNRTFAIRAISPGGTVVTLATNQCGNVFTGVTDHTLTLGVIGPAGNFSIASHGQFDPPGELDPRTTGALVVNDAGAVAGMDAKGLWLAPEAGPFERAGVTNATSLRLDRNDDVWFARKGGVEKWTATGIGALDVAWAAWGYSGDPALLSVNTRGQLLVRATKAGGRTAAVLLSPVLSVSLAVDKVRAYPGEPIRVTATLSALGGVPLTGIAPVGGLEWKGTTGARVVSGPTPVPPMALGANAAASFEWTCLATNVGFLRFGVRFAGLNGAVRVESPSASSAVVWIPESGDLLVKRGDEPDSEYGLLGVRQGRAEGGQARTNSVARTEVSEFQVRVLNNAGLPRKYRLLAFESPYDLGPVASTWATRYFLGARDVTSEILDFEAGLRLPELPAGGAHVIDVRVSGVDAKPGGELGVDFQLKSDGEPPVFLDTVLARTELRNEIVVNSTADLANVNPVECCCDTGRRLKDGSRECTLRAALEFANFHRGPDLIRFEIPDTDPAYDGGYPVIAPESGLPEVTDTLEIDGINQLGSGGPVTLTGARIQRPGAPPASPGTSLGPSLMTWGGAASGLTLSARSKISGLVIQEFPLAGVAIRAASCEIRECAIGMDVRGEVPRPNGLAGPEASAVRGCGIAIFTDHNLIRDNLIAGGGQDVASATGFHPPGLLLSGPAATENEILGNLIGTDTSGSRALYGEGLGPEFVGRPMAGILVENAPRNTVGAFPEVLSDGANVISGNLNGVWIEGAGAERNYVVGNYLGTDPTGQKDVGNGVGVVVHGAPRNYIGSPGAGNLIAGNVIGVWVYGPASQFVFVEANYIGASGLDPARVPPANHQGILIGPGAVSTIVETNVINLNSYNGITVDRSTNSRIAENQVIITGHGSDSNGSGIRIAAGTGNVLSQNEISDTVGLGISLGSEGHVPNPIREGVPVDGPNALQNYPLVTPGHAVRLAGGWVRVSGVLTSRPAGTYRLEFFASTGANPLGFGDGESFLGAEDLFVGGSGSQAFEVLMPLEPEDGNFLTATATSPAGNTSEFSPAVLVQNCAPGVEGICPATEDLVPGAAPDRNGTLQSRHPGATPVSRTGDGNADGIPDSRQANVTSFPGLAGPWITLAAPERVVLTDVGAIAPPDPARVPSGYSFPAGFVGFGLTNLPAGAEVRVEVLLHDIDLVQGAPAAWTYFNHGPTADQPEPHWYEFRFDGQTGAEFLADRIVLHFRDGARGGDGWGNPGFLATVGGPALRTSGAPVLGVASLKVGSRSVTRVEVDSRGRLVKTSEDQPVVECVLEWPGPSADFVLQSLDALGAAPSFGSDVPVLMGDLWRPVRETPVLEGGRYVVTNRAGPTARFYRLASRPLSRVTAADHARFGSRTFTWIGRGSWGSATNWRNSALVRDTPPAEGVADVGIVFPAGVTPIVSSLDRGYSVRSVTVAEGAPSLDLSASADTAGLVLGTGGWRHGTTNASVFHGPIRLAADQGWVLAAGVLTVDLLDLEAQRLSLSGAGRLEVGALMGSASSRLEIGGTVSLAAGGRSTPSPFAGTVEVDGGTVELDPGIVRSAAAIVVTAGTWAFPGGASLDSLAAVRLAGGELRLGGASGRLGVLELAGEGVLRLGSGTGSIAFADVVLSAGGHLRVFDWQGVGGVTGTGPRISVPGFPSAASLAQIDFVGDGFERGAIRLPTGELVPIAKVPSVLADDAPTLFQVYGTGMTKTVVDITGQAFTRAMRVVTSQKPAQAYNSGVLLRTAAAVAANDNLLARFWVRRIAPSTGTAQVQFNFEQAGGTFDKSVQVPVTLADGAWQFRTVKFKSRAAYAAGGAEVSFWTGYGVQTVEIGGLEVLNYRGSTPP